MRATAALQALRLGYAQHIYRQQGATVERAVVLTGGWQTSKESSYVQASRARKGTEWHLAREELGTEGTDLDRIERLAKKMRSSRSQTPSVEYATVEGRASSWIRRSSRVNSASQPSRRRSSPANTSSASKRSG